MKLRELIFSASNTDTNLASIISLLKYLSVNSNIRTQNNEYRKNSYFICSVSLKNLPEINQIRFLIVYFVTLEGIEKKSATNLNKKLKLPPQLMRFCQSVAVRIPEVFRHSLWTRNTSLNKYLCLFKKVENFFVLLQRCTQWMTTWGLSFFATFLPTADVKFSFFPNAPNGNERHFNL